MDNEQTTRRLKALVIALAVLLAASLGLTGYLMGAQASTGAATAQAAEQAPDAQNLQTKYTLYIGTNDKDTYKQEIPYDECVEKVTEICTSHTGGCTLSQATGYWTDDSGAITSEQSIVCTLEDISLDQVHAIADEVREALNQNSILIETSDVTSEFYAG